MSSPFKLQSDAPLTISDLLTSLHTHLQTQTQLLPTLHAQLGLPQSALTDELSSLHQRLAVAVEEQIHARREEVDNWMKKCDVVERECLKYTKALGGHAKVISTSVGELRKQQVLPVRHEMLNQYQEKLDHLYKKKHEQLMNLVNRVNSLAQTLGFDFFAADVVEPAPLLETSPVEGESVRDVTPERFTKLEKELVRGKGEITRRLQHIATSMLQIEWLYEELGIPLPSCDEPTSFPSSSSTLLPLNSSHKSRCPSPADPFLISVSTPTPCPRGVGSNLLLENDNESIDCFRIFQLFLQHIYEADAEGKLTDSNAAIGLEGVEPSLVLLAWVEETRNKLEGIKKQREMHIQSMYDQLEALWKRLGVTNIDIDEFVDNNRGSTKEVVLSYESELERMLELKRDRMSVFIGNARGEIEALWDELMIGQGERADFIPFTDDEHTEELLSIHEEEIRQLKEERKKKAPLLEKLRKYFEICEGEKELAAAAMDQSRLLGRGPRDPGRLLREEKMRKRVMREKPKLEQDLLVAIPAWEEEEGRAFLVDGVGVIDMLAEAVASHDKENTRKGKARSGSVPPRATTPSESRPLEGRVTRAVSAASNKRAKLTNSTSITMGQRVPSSSSRPTPAHDLAHRAPFGSRSGALNSSTSSSFGTSYTDAAPPTTQKRAKTPAGTVRRPTSAASKSRPPPQPAPSVQKSAGYKLGVSRNNEPSSTLNRSRAVSASAAATKTYTTSGSYTHVNTRATLQPPSRIVSANRRESFRPRPSMDVGY